MAMDTHDDTSGPGLVGPDNLVMPEGDYAGAVDYTQDRRSGRHRCGTSTSRELVRPCSRQPSDGWCPHACSWISVTPHPGPKRTSSPTSRPDTAPNSPATIDCTDVCGSIVGYAAGVDNFDNFSINRSEISARTRLRRASESHFRRSRPSLPTTRVSGRETTSKWGVSRFRSSSSSDRHP